MGAERAALNCTVIQPALAAPASAAVFLPNAPLLVLDTNIVLDIWLFSDPRSAGLLPLIAQRERLWLATPAMRDELERVLGYPRLVRQLAARGVLAQSLLAAFDTYAHTMLDPAPAPAALKCQDADDQKFIDLAWAHSAELVSRDQAVLAVLQVIKRLQKPAEPPF